MSQQRETIRIVGRAAHRSTVLMCVGTFLFWGALYVYVPIMPVYAEYLGASLALVGMVVAAYGLLQMLLRIPVGIFSDWRGQRKPFVVGGFVAAAVGCLGMALSPNPWFLVVFRGVLGIAAATWVTSTILFSSYFAASQTAQALGLITFFSALAQVISAPIGGKLADSYGWLAPFYAGAAMAVLGMLCTLAISEEPRPPSNKLSLKRIVRLTTAPSLLTVSLIAAAVQYASFATTFGFIPLYANGLGATKTDLGLLVAAAMVPRTLATLLSAPLATRLGNRVAVAVSIGMMAASALVVPLIHNVFLLGLSQTLSGAGWGLSYPLLMAISIRAVPHKEQATAMGVFQAVYALGMFVGPAVGGLLADSLGLASVFISSGIMCLVGAAWALLGISKPPEAR